MVCYLYTTLYDWMMPIDFSKPPPVVRILVVVGALWKRRLRELGTPRAGDHKIVDYWRLR